MSSQPGKPDDLDGSVPDTHPITLLLIDVINDFDFPGGDQLLASALEIAPCIRDLIRRARSARVPVLYANDNFGRWQSNFDQLLRRCLEPGRSGSRFVAQIVPETDDYIVLKPKHSAFYQTPLDVLLKHLGTERLILAGFCTNSCILFTAHDAYMRDLEVFVPPDCTAAHTKEDHTVALEQMKVVIKARICPSGELEF